MIRSGIDYPHAPVILIEARAINNKNSLGSALAIIVLFVSFTATAVAGPFEDGLAAYHRSDYAEARDIWLPLAERGDAGAQFFLGLLYFEARTELGENLALIYGEQHGVLRDYAEAMKWFRKAARQGNTGGQLRLGDMYEYGWGVPQDYEKAVKWYRLAADRGDTGAQFRLGEIFESGRLVAPQDYVQAHKWYNLAAAEETDAKLRDYFANNRDGVASKMTLAQIAEAQKLAREWKPMLRP